MSRPLNNVDVMAQVNTAYSLSHGDPSTPLDQRSIEKDDKEAGLPDAPVEEIIRQDDGVTRIEALCTSTPRCCHPF